MILGRSDSGGIIAKRSRAPPLPKLTDPERLKCFLAALANWRYDGFLEFRPLAQDWLQQEMPNLTQRELRRILFAHVQAGGEIDEVVERRPEWADFGFHYDLRPTVVGKRLYVESLLKYRDPEDPDDPDDPVIIVVNVHWA